ncbi:MAG: ABC transporter substrate-binding protein [Hyphomicrobiaceae bacterium]
MTDVRFHRCRRWLLLLAAMVVGIAGAPARADEPSRILSAGGAITEVLYELGVQDRIVAVDSTSNFPPEALKTHKNVGYFRTLSTEGVLSMAPDLIIASDKAGPPEVVRALKSSGIEYFEVNDDPNPEALVARVKAIADKVGKAESGADLVRRIEKGFAELAAARARLKRTPSALFVLSLQGGRATIGGTDTTADAMLTLAGAKNAASSLKGFKPISEESIIAMDPEAIVIMSRSSGHGVGSEVLKLPGVAATRAGRDRRVIEMDGLYLMGFGPRAPAAATDLMNALQTPAPVPDGAAAPKTPGTKG